MKIDIQIAKVGNEHWELHRCERLSDASGNVFSYELFARVFLDPAQDRYVAEAAVWEGKIGSQPNWIRIGKTYLRPDIAFRFLTKGGMAEA